MKWVQSPRALLVLSAIVLVVLVVGAAWRSGPEDLSVTVVARTGEAHAAERAKPAGTALASVLADSVEPGARESLSVSRAAAALDVADDSSRLSVRVKSGRRPVPGADVSVRVGDEPISGDAARTDRRGRTQLDVMPGTAVEIVVRARGTAAEVRQAVTTPPPGERRTVVVDLSSYRSTLPVKIQVVSYPSGLPLSGARIRFEPKFRPRDWAPVDARTDAKGFASVPWLADGSYVVSAQGHGQVEVPSPTDAERESVCVELPEDARLYGQLVQDSVQGDHGPVPPELRVVEGESLEEVRPRQRSVSGSTKGALEQAEWTDATLEPWKGAGVGHAKFFIDESGRWRIRGLRFRSPGETKHLSLMVSHTGGERTLATGIEVRPGALIEVQDIYADAPSVDLQLRDASGSVSTGGFRVTLERTETDQGVLEHTAWIDETGRLFLPRLPKGRWLVSQEARFVTRNRKYGERLVKQAAAEFGVFDHLGPRAYDLVLKEEPTASGPVPILTR
ncbi:hypothetical protein Poly30_49000 [Planctomycetes bacterium Poly30]|uniref:Uncharacterized protein n=1 Tax=Saltatorellus ferox TaxID=2528018 RepID=A0A518EZ23_9BACT|nr:hypothetical protein Poly30_49000 [Planctomycetes bacterium Poly30]